MPSRRISYFSSYVFYVILCGRHHKFLIGRDRAALKELEKESGAFVFFPGKPKGTETSNEIVVILGEHFNKRNTAHIIPCSRRYSSCIKSERSHQSACV